MTTRKERLALNQAAFRIANERMSEWPERREERRSTGSSTYFCECSRTDCRAILRLTSDEYEAVRAASRRFAIAPGHESPKSSAWSTTTVDTRWLTSSRKWRPSWKEPTRDAATPRRLPHEIHYRIPSSLTLLDASLAPAASAALRSR